MININRHSLAAALIADINAISDSAFLETLDAHDDAAHFADILLVEGHDDTDMMIAIFCTADASDDAIDAALDEIGRTFRDDRDFLYPLMLDAITRRIALLRP